MSQQIEYREQLPTGFITQFLMTCRDQVATTKDLAEHFNVTENCVREAMARLLRVNRVDEIFPNMWHLE